MDEDTISKSMQGKNYLINFAYMYAILICKTTIHFMYVLNEVHCRYGALLKVMKYAACKIQSWLSDCIVVAIRKHCFSVHFDIMYPF